MRFSWGLWASVALCIAAVPRAQSTPDLSTLPQCGIQCFQSSILNSVCLPTNTTCICTTESLQNEMGTCVAKACNVKDALSVKNTTVTLCGLPVRNKEPQYRAVLVSFQIIAGAFVVQRFSFKIYARLRMELDDWFALLCVAGSIPITVLGAMGILPNGLGRDIWTVPPDRIYKFGKYFYLSEVVYFTDVMLLKLAMLFFFLRIFPAKPVRRLIWGTIAFNTVYGIIFIFVAMFQCKPISFFWEMWDGEHTGSCMNVNAIGWSNASISIALDGWMLAIPLFQLKSLNLDWKKKIGVSAMFSVGFFVSIVSILRLHSLVKFGAGSKNPTWEFYDSGLWSTIEIQVGIICNCLPSFRLLLVRLFPRVFGTNGAYSNEYNKNAPRTRTNKSIQLRSTDQSSAHDPYHRQEGIVYSKSYTVEYSENDEIELVRVKDLDRKSAKSSQNSF